MEMMFIRGDEIEHIRTRVGAVVIDMRENEAYCREHVPNAINIPYQEYEQWCRFIPRELPLILYCSRGNISLYAAHKMETDREVYTIAGGVHVYENISTEPCNSPLSETENH